MPHQGSCHLLHNPDGVCGCGTTNQASELRRLALYFDVGSELWRTDIAWTDLQPGQWDELFQPSITAPREGEQAPQHSYVLRPLDGSTSYLLRGPKARSSEQEAVQQADVSLDAVSLHVSSAPHRFAADCQSLGDTAT